MANRGKSLQSSGGSRSRSVAKAEDRARRSRTRADKHNALADARRDLEQDPPERSPAYDALALLHIANWEFGLALARLGRQVANPPVGIAGR